ncbi:MAG: hypothetical protein NTW64_04030 [Candidatus Omnitrophica bacterium]|nr:hypothetical protein [Candidatus Omnitrophota bacterium]
MRMRLRDVGDPVTLQKWINMQKKKMNILSIINIIFLGIDITILILLFLFSVVQGIPLFHTYKSFNVTIPLVTQIAIISAPFVFVFYAFILISKEKLKRKVITVIVNLAVLIVIIITVSFYVRAIYLPMAELEAASDSMSEEE